jgi:hypothetical protein
MASAGASAIFPFALERLAFSIRLKMPVGPAADGLALSFVAE